MQRKAFGEMNCSIALALDEIGEWWTLLIIRECFLGTTRFDDFKNRLGIARNILNTRFKKLIDLGVVQKIPLEDMARREGYYLTPKGEGLFPVIVALQQWGDDWLSGPAGPPILLVENETGQALAPVGPRSDYSARKLGFRDIRLEVGPGAGAATARRVAERNSAILDTVESGRRLP